MDGGAAHGWPPGGLEAAAEFWGRRYFHVVYRASPGPYKRHQASPASVESVTSYTQRHLAC